MFKKLLPLLFVITLLLTACAGGASDADAIATSVAATLQATNPLPPTAETGGGLVGLTGIVEGTICFPSQGIPAMTLYLQLIGTQEVAIIPIAQNQTSFSTEITTGTYTAYAWLPDFSFGGSYSHMVACGLTADCTDHSLIEFTVPAGGTVSEVDVCDWYGDPGSVPMPPGVEAPRATGSIAGTLIYPSEFIPPMQVVAFNVDSDQFFWTSTDEGSSTYQIDNLPAGTYFVVAYAILDGGGGDFGGGYTPAVACGLSVECTDHSLTPIQVSAGQVASNINPHDWYAPQGSFPQNPAP